MPDMRDAIAQYLASGGRQNQMPPLGDLMGYQAGQNAAAPMAGPPQGMPGMDMRPDLLTPANGSQNAFGPPMPNLQANPGGRVHAADWGSSGATHAARAAARLWTTDPINHAAHHAAA